MTDGCGFVMRCWQKVEKCKKMQVTIVYVVKKAYLCTKFETMPYPIVKILLLNQPQSNVQGAKMGSGVASAAQ